MIVIIILLLLFIIFPNITAAIVYLAVELIVEGLRIVLTVVILNQFNT